MVVFIILDSRNQIRGFPYPDRAMAEEHLLEANLTWNTKDNTNPHRIVPFVPESTRVVEMR